MDYETLDSVVMTDEPVKDLERASGTLAMGIASIPLCMNLIGIILAILTLVRTGKAISKFKNNPFLYTESSYKKMKAARICAIISLCLLGTAIPVIIVLVGVN